MIACAVCGSRYGDGNGGWTALPIVQTVTAAGVKAHLSVPADWAVEVRRCRCGASLARRSRGARSRG